jgi:hypothetical protein
MGMLHYKLLASGAAINLLYIVTLAVYTIWMVALIRKKQLSWHSIVLSYVMAVFSADMLEVTFNLLLNLYKFPTHLSSNHIAENELGIVFADTLILPFTFIVFVYYARKGRPWTTSLLFALISIISEWIYLRMGYMKYIHWSLAYSAAIYLIGFRFGAYLAPRIASYDPPVPYRVRLLCFNHTIIMWVGALFASPLLTMYQFRPGIFKDTMADCRFTDLVSGDILNLLCVLFIPKMPNRFKPLVLTLIACVGVSFAMYSYYQGWLIYHHWNHFFMALRYFIPLALIMLYDRWEQLKKRRE